ncbi:MAG: hypothetical protein ABIL62_10730 [Planctomycetota bacterium]
MLRCARNDGGVCCAQNYIFVLRRAYRVLRERLPFGCAPTFAEAPEGKQGKLTGEG